MRSSNIILLAATVLFLGVGSALSAVQDGNSAAISEAHPIRRFLKEVSATEYDGKKDEERAAINLSFLETINKYFPGTEAWVAWKAAAKSKRLAKAIQKQKMKDMFKVTGTDDHQLFKKFEEWYKLGYRDSAVVTNFVAAMRLEGTDAVAIGNAYKRWLSTKNGGHSLFP